MKIIFIIFFSSINNSIFLTQVFFKYQISTNATELTFHLLYYHNWSIDRNSLKIMISTLNQFIYQIKLQAIFHVSG